MKVKPSSSAMAESAHGREDDLPDTRQHGDAAHVPDLVQAQLEAHQEEQQRNADFRDEVDGVVYPEQPRHRPEQQSRRDVGDDARDAQPRRHDDHDGGGHQDGAQAAQQEDIGQTALRFGEDGVDP
jgi:hypothetical protein